MIQKHRIHIGFFLVVVSLFLGSGIVRAQSKNNAITVEPASLTFDLTASSTQKVAMLTIRNDYDSPVDLAASFQGIDEAGGRIVPVGDPSIAISETLKLSQTAFTIQPHEKYFLKVVATDNSTLHPGGHYATLVLTNTTDSVRSSVSSQVSVGVFVVKRDGATTKVVLTKNQLDNNIFSLPSRVDLEIINDGNTHVVPRASVQIFDSKGRLISDGIYNGDSKLLLPGKKLAQQVELIAQAKIYVPQKLTMRVNYRVDGTDDIKTYEKTFWYLPPSFIVLFLTGVAFCTTYAYIYKLRSVHNAKSKNTPKIS